MSEEIPTSDRGTGAIDNGDPQMVTLSGREYERYLCGALNVPVKPSKDDIDAELELAIMGYDRRDKYPEWSNAAMREAYRAGWEDGAR